MFALHSKKNHVTIYIFIILALSQCSLRSTDLETVMTHVATRMNHFKPDMHTIIDDQFTQTPTFVQTVVAEEGNPIAHARNGILITAPVSIFQSGSYTLGTNLSRSGIVLSINVSDVVLDLNGFEVNRINSGDVITVAPGVSNVVIQNGFVSTGNATGFGASSGIRLANNVNVKIEGISFNHQVTSGTTGITVTSSSSVSTVISEQISITNCGFFQGTTGISVTNAFELFIQNCYFRDHVGDGVTIDTVDTCFMENNVAVFNGGNGFNCANLIEAIIVDNFLVKNTGTRSSTATSGNGILITGASSHISMERNFCFSNARNGIVSSATNSNFKNNECIGNGENDLGAVNVVTVSGITTTGRGCLFTGNVCNNNILVRVPTTTAALRVYGINNSGADSVFINNFSSNNTVSGSTNRAAYGISNAAFDCTLQENTCDNNLTDGINILADSDNNTIVTNYCSNNFRDGIRIENGAMNNHIAGNTCNTNGGIGFNKLVTIDACAFIQNRAQRNGVAPFSILQNYNAVIPATTITTLTIAGVFGGSTNPYANISIT